MIRKIEDKMRSKPIIFAGLGIVIGIIMSVVGVFAILRMEGGHLGDLVIVGPITSGVCIWRLVVWIRSRKGGVAPGGKG